MFSGQKKLEVQDCDVNILFIAEELDRPEAHLISGIVHLGHHIILMMPTEKNTPAVLEGAVERFPVRLDGRIDREGIRSIRHTVQDCDIDIVHCLRNNRPVSNALMAAISIFFSFALLDISVNLIDKIVVGIKYD